MTQFVNKVGIIQEQQNSAHYFFLRNKENASCSSTWGNLSSFFHVEQVFVLQPTLIFVLKQQEYWELSKGEIWYLPKKRAETRGWVGLDVKLSISDEQGVREMSNWPIVQKKTHRNECVCAVSRHPRDGTSSWERAERWASLQKRHHICLSCPVCAAGPSESSVSKHAWPLAKQRPDQKKHKCTKYLINGSVMRAGIAVSQHFVSWP